MRNSVWFSIRFIQQNYCVETGNDRIVLELQQRVSSHPNKNRSFHYLPYRTDSGFEQDVYKRQHLDSDYLKMTEVIKNEKHSIHF